MQIRLHTELKISSCCDVGCQNRLNTASNYKFDLIPAASARQKTTTAVVKRDKTSGLHRNIVKHDRVCSARLSENQRSIKYCLLLLWARLISVYDYTVYEIMSVH